MKFLVKTRVLQVDPERYRHYKGRDIPYAEVVFESDDSYFAASVLGAERLQRCKEAQISGKEIYCVFSVAGTQYEKDDGRTGYFNYINLKQIL